MTGEPTRVEVLSDWYLHEQLDFDKRLIRFRYQTLKPHFRGPNGLELGPAEGEMTRYLVDDFARLTIVDGSAQLLARVADAPNLCKVHALVEEFEPRETFDTIILDHILEHVADPVQLLERVRRWSAADGRILLGVPNGHSIHRLVAVKMGLLGSPTELNERDHALGHRRVYTIETFRRDVEAAGLRILETGGVFFKPLSNQQIQDDWTEDMIQGFYELGKDFGEYSAELYAVCQP
jgi:2-polyprenyl-3-methyl-5-hydroxy-6-metoxy-1,4-benzoquinol methylase